MRGKTAERRNRAFSRFKGLLHSAAATGLALPSAAVAFFVVVLEGRAVANRIWVQFRENHGADQVLWESGGK